MVQALPVFPGQGVEVAFRGEMLRGGWHAIRFAAFGHARLMYNGSVPNLRVAGTAIR